MAAAASAKPDPSAQRRRAAQELLGLEQKHAPVLARMKGIRKALIAFATAGGENFQELFDRIGVVKVARAKPSKVNGEIPELDTAVFLALPPRERDQMIKRGLVKMVESKTGAYYGAVTVDLF